MGKIIRQFRRLVGGLQKIGITGEQTVLEKGRQLTVRHLGKLEQTTLTVETLEVRVVQGKGLNDRRTEGWGQVIHEDGNGIQAHGRAKAQFLIIRDRANGQVSSIQNLANAGVKIEFTYQVEVVSAARRELSEFASVGAKRSSEEITVIDPQIEVLDGMGRNHPPLYLSIRYAGRGMQGEIAMNTAERKLGDLVAVPPASVGASTASLPLP